MATQTQEVTQRLAPFQEKFLEDIFAQANALKSSTMPFAPEQMAGLSPQQQQAIATAQQGVGAYQPYMQRAGQSLAQAGAFTQPGAAAQFFNPYENQVVDQTMRDLSRQGAIQQNQLGAQAAGSGAFGGSRMGVAQSELAGRTLDAQARAAGQLRQQGYTQAQQAAAQAAQLANQQAGMYGNLAGQSQAMGVQDINTMLGIGGLTQQQGYTDPVTGQVFTGQAELDLMRRNSLSQQALPYQQIGFLSDLFRGVPALQQTYSQTTTPPPSTSSQLLGLGIAGIGAAGQAGGFGNLFNPNVRPN
jgi:hypothetical protein